MYIYYRLIEKISFSVRHNFSTHLKLSLCVNEGADLISMVWKARVSRSLLLAFPLMFPDFYF